MLSQIAPEEEVLAVLARASARPWAVGARSILPVVAGRTALNTEVLKPRREKFLMVRALFVLIVFRQITNLVHQPPLEARCIAPAVPSYAEAEAFHPLAQFHHGSWDASLVD